MMVALLAGPFLGEWIGWRRAIGIVVGFSGILIAFRPGFTEFHPAFLVSMGSMLAYAFFSLVTRYLAPYDRAEVTLFYSLFAGTILAAPFAWAQWVPPDGFVGWTLMLSTGLYSGLGHYLFIVAHRYAPASTLMPFIYITLLTHTAAGYVVFDQLPDAWTHCRRRRRRAVGPLPAASRARHPARRRRVHDRRRRQAAVRSVIPAQAGIHATIQLRWLGVVRCQASAGMTLSAPRTCRGVAKPQRPHCFQSAAIWSSVAINPARTSRRMRRTACTCSSVSE